VRLLLALCAAAACAPLQAQQVAVTCRPAETVQQCRERFQPTGGVPDTTALDTVKAKAAGEVAERLQAKPTGTDLSTEGPLSAIRDFLPRLAGALLAPTSGDDPASLGFKANLPLNDGVLLDWGMTAQLAAVVNEADVFGPLIDSIPTGLREGARTRFKEGLEPYDDVSLTLALNLENRTFGRGMRQHRRDVDALAREILAPFKLTPDPRIRATIEYNLFRARFDQLVLADDGTFALVDQGRAAQPECRILRPGEAPAAGRPRDSGAMRVDCFTPAAQDTIEARTATLATATTRSIRRAEEAIRASGFNRLAQLMNNQPQINANGEYRSRRDVVGPNEWTGTARFELGFANMNGLRRYCRATGLTPACLERYMNAPGVRGSLSRGDRLFAQVELTRRNSWRFQSAEDSVDLALGRALTMAVSTGYGAYLGNPDDGENRDRVDVQAKWDMTRDDPIRQNRFVSTLFYTRRLSDQSSALIGLTYANRPEFLGDVDNRVRANLGLTYKLNQPKESVAGTDSP
jgi:hypothetical protein